LHNIIITGFPTEVDKNTFRVSSGTGYVKILEVSYTVVHTEDTPKEIKASSEEYKEKIKKLNTDLEVLNKTRTRLQEEEDYLHQYSTTLHSPIKVSIPDGREITHKHTTIEDATAFLNLYREKLVSIKSQKLKLNKSQTELQEQIEVLETLNKTKPVKSTERRQVAIEIRVSDISLITLELTYIIKGGSWTSSYDVRVDTDLDSLTLIYYGSIVNTTQEDWQDVSLTLSTAEPAVGGFPPPLYPILVQNRPAPYLEDEYYSESDDDESAEEILPEKEKEKKSSYSTIKLKKKSAKTREKKLKPVPAIKEQTSRVEEMVTGSSYQIMRKSTIASDGKPHKVTVAHLDLSVIFEYVCAPTKSPNCYLRANAKNESTLNLLKGPMNIFINNYFITKSKLLSTNPKEDFRLYLGVDPGVKVDFQPIAKSESSQSRFIQRVKFDTVTHTTKIRNLKKKAVSVVVFDQKPLITNTEQIKLKIDEPRVIPSPEVIVDEFSIISWNIKLEPEQEQTVVFKYSLEYPVDKTLDEIEQTNVQGELRF